MRSCELLGVEYFSRKGAKAQIEDEVDAVRKKNFYKQLLMSFWLTRKS